MGKIPITKDGYQALINEFENLKTVERPKVIKAIEEARSHGDLSENAECDAAKERQAFIEGRINDIGYKISNADIIDDTNLPKGKVVFASKVLLENMSTGNEVMYQLVGPEESDINKGRISVVSPLGKALIGKKLNDEITIEAPGGKRKYILVRIL